MHGLDCDARCAAVALPEREELMSSRGDRGGLPARSRKSVQRSAIAPRENAAFGIFWTSVTKRNLKDFESDENLFSTSGGPFSVSRVAIMLGQVSLVGWLVLGLGHAVALMFDGADILRVLTAYAPILASLLLIGGVVCVFIVLKDRVQSTSL